MSEEQKPTLKLRTDDADGIAGELTVTVDKSLARVVLTQDRKRNKQLILTTEYMLSPSDFSRLAQFLSDAAWWMHSGYKDEKKPESRDYS